MVCAHVCVCARACPVECMAVKFATLGVTISPPSVDLAKQHSTHFTQLTV